MLACTLIVFVSRVLQREYWLPRIRLTREQVFSALSAASKGPGAQGTINALM